MKVGQPEFDSRFLGSAVGRRILLVVGTCALLPVGAFAIFAYQRVSDQLGTNALATLHRASKAASMGILDRLLLAEDALLRRGELAEGSRSLPAGAPEHTPMLRSVERISRDDPRWASLSRRERAHFERGRTLLRLDRNDSGEARVLLVRAARDADGRELIAAELEPDYLFAGLFASDDRFWVEDATGTTIVAGNGRASNPDAELLTAQWQLFLRASFGADSWSIRLGRPADVVYRPLREFEAVFPWIAAVALLTALGLSVHQIRRTLVPIIALTEGAEQIAQRNYSARVKVFTRDEFGRLSQAFNAMAETTGRQIDILSTVNRVGATLSAQRENGPVVDAVLRGSLEVTRAEAGALLLIEDGSTELTRLHVGERLVQRGAAVEAALPRGAIERCLAGHAAIRREVDAEERDKWRAFDAHLPRPVASYLAVPMRNEKRENVGVLLLLRTGPEAFSEQEAALAESLASQASVAIRKNQLVASFRGLFEGLIQLIVRAIDEKSPYTGDHCRNVPVLTELIADAACATQDGLMKDFELSAEERYELRIAALLHDCGKVVTPVHVMDKATKLQTIFDRIELVETRFEMLRRDAKLRALSRCLDQAGLDPSPDDARLAQELRELDADFAYVRACNAGSEGMPEASVERVREIAHRYRWTTRSGQEREALEADEIENLVVRRGTLNDAERRVIEHHVVATMTLLEQLPFPHDMRGVPAIAGAHHERMDGGGYPLRLRGDQLSLQARILGLADVFEALTARDRPYKTGRTLRETLDILQRMVEAGHIDRPLYDLFVRHRVHLRYAAVHMSPEQIDREFHAELEELTGL